MTRKHQHAFVHPLVNEAQGNVVDAGLRLRPGEQVMRYLLGETERRALMVVNDSRPCAKWRRNHATTGERFARDWQVKRTHVIPFFRKTEIKEATTFGGGLRYA